MVPHRPEAEGEAEILDLLCDAIKTATQSQVRLLIDEMQTVVTTLVDIDILLQLAIILGEMGNHVMQLFGCAYEKSRRGFGFLLFPVFRDAFGKGEESFHDQAEFRR